MSRPDLGRDPNERVVLLGAARTPLRDLYLRFLWMRWDHALGTLALAVLMVNLLFAALYRLVGGVHGMRDELLDALFFSVQTLATIGYGAMYPVSLPAHLLVTLEALVGMLMAALVTGLLFAKFTISGSRVRFAEQATIACMDGVPTLSFRVGNRRENRLIEAHIRVVLTRSMKTREGESYYRLTDLTLQRDRAPALSWAWTVRHPITPDSPLYGFTPEQLEREQLEFLVTIVGLDDTSLQSVHALHNYLARDLRWGVRFADMLSEGAGGEFVIDLRCFDELIPMAAQPGFPYSDGRKLEA